jgi:hypothetical protein
MIMNVIVVLIHLCLVEYWLCGLCETDLNLNRYQWKIISFEIYRNLSKLPWGDPCMNYFFFSSCYFLYFSIIFTYIKSKSPRKSSYIYILYSSCCYHFLQTLHHYQNCINNIIALIDIE